MKTAQQILASYRGNQKWITDRSVFICRHGSHAYGTNGPDSDEDYKGIFIAPREYFLGYLNRIDQVDNGFDDDVCLFNLPRFFSLASDCNPNIIEILYINPSDYLYITRDWQQITEKRDLFLSQNAKHRFSGYAFSQLKRIRTHRRWLLHPPSHQPTRSEYRLPDQTSIPSEMRDAANAQMQKVVEGWQVDFACLDEPTRIDIINRLNDSLADMKLASDGQYYAAGKKLGFDDNFMEYLKNERAYRAASAEWTQYQTWLRERNPKRAELEKKFLVDTKHAAHLVRLLRMAREILTGQGVIVKRPDAEELKAIRFHGAWTYDQIVEWAEKQDAELTEMMKTSALPKHPDRNAIDKLCVDIVSRWI